MKSRPRSFRPKCFSMQSMHMLSSDFKFNLRSQKTGIEHAVVADLNDVDSAPVAFVPGDFSARKAIDGRFLTDVFHCRGSGRRAARMLAPSGLMTIGQTRGPCSY